MCEIAHVCHVSCHRKASGVVINSECDISITRSTILKVLKVVLNRNSVAAFGVLRCLKNIRLRVPLRICTLENDLKRIVDVSCRRAASVNKFYSERVPYGISVLRDSYFGTRDVGLRKLSPHDAVPVIVTAGISKESKTGTRSFMYGTTDIINPQSTMPCIGGAVRKFPEHKLRLRMCTTVI